MPADAELFKTDRKNSQILFAAQFLLLISNRIINQNFQTHLGTSHFVLSFEKQDQMSDRYDSTLQCTMGEIGLLNVTQKYFITSFCFGTTLKFNYLLCGYSYWRVNYIFVMATNLTIMQQFLTLFNPILAKWHLFAHSALCPCTQAAFKSPALLELRGMGTGLIWPFDPPCKP